MKLNKILTKLIKKTVKINQFKKKVIESTKTL